MTANDLSALIWAFAGVREAATSGGGGETSSPHQCELLGIFQPPGFQRFSGELR